MSGHPPPVARAAVVGAGTMGTGIAQVLASAGIDVTLVDRDEEALKRAAKTLRARLAPAKDRAGALRTSVKIEDAAEADVAIEAVFEKLDVKREVFAALDAALPPGRGVALRRGVAPGALLATNTSSLSVADIASATKRPERVVGMHFMNPAPVMKLVEVVRAEATSEETVERAKALAEQTGKVPVVVADRPCFVVNRVLIPMLNEAARALEEGAASPEDIDSCMKLGANFRMGPLHLADLIGLDVVLEELERLEETLGERYSPSREIRSRVREGSLGRKTGQGFFTYGGPCATAGSSSRVRHG